MKTLQLHQIINTKSSELFSIISDWEQYSTESVLLAYLDSKRRQMNMGEDEQKKFTEFIDSQHTTLDILIEEFCKKNNVNNYIELFALKTTPVETEASLRNKQLKNEYYKQQYNNSKSAASKDLLIGGLIFFIGCVVTLATMSSGSGGIIAYGAIIFGFIRMIGGLIKYLND